MAYWKAAGISYLQYIGLATTSLRQVRKDRRTTTRRARPADQQSGHRRTADITTHDAADDASAVHGDSVCSVLFGMRFVSAAHACLFPLCWCGSPFVSSVGRSAHRSPPSPSSLVARAGCQAGCCAEVCHQGGCALQASGLGQLQGWRARSDDDDDRRAEMS